MTGQLGDPTCGCPACDEYREAKRARQAPTTEGLRNNPYVLLTTLPDPETSEYDKVVMYDVPTPYEMVLHFPGDPSYPRRVMRQAPLTPLILVRAYRQWGYIEWKPTYLFLGGPSSRTTRTIPVDTIIDPEALLYIEQQRQEIDLDPHPFGVFEVHNPPGSGYSSISVRFEAQPTIHRIYGWADPTEAELHPYGLAVSR